MSIVTIIVGVAVIAAILVSAWLVDRPPKCDGCGWRQGHHPACPVLRDMVLAADRRTAELFKRVNSGELTPLDAMKLVQRGEG